MTSLSLAITKPADVQTVANLGLGDYYKRLESSSYSSKMVYGIITDIVANTEAVAVEVTEFEESYGSTSTTTKVYNADTELQLFPASVDDLIRLLPGIIDGAASKVASARQALSVAEKSLAEVKALAERINPLDPEVDKLVD